MMARGCGLPIRRRSKTRSATSQARSSSSSGPQCHRSQRAARGRSRYCRPDQRPRVSRRDRNGPLPCTNLLGESHTALLSVPPACRGPPTTGTTTQPCATRALTGSAIQCGMVARASASSSISSRERTGRTVSSPSWISARPSQAKARMTSPALRRGARELPARRMAQFDFQTTEPQAAIGAGCEIDRPHRDLGCEAENMRRGAAAGDDGLAPHGRERLNPLVDAGRARPKPGFDGLHVDPLADPHQPPERARRERA